MNVYKLLDKYGEDSSMDWNLLYRRWDRTIELCLKGCPWWNIPRKIRLWHDLKKWSTVYWIRKGAEDRFWYKQRLERMYGKKT